MSSGGLDECLDVARRISRALGKRADLACDDGKTLARLASACCLDAGIKSQEIGLEENPIDDVYNLRYFFCGLLDCAHRHHRFANHGTAFGSTRMGFRNRGSCGAGTVRSLPRQADSLTDRGGGLFETSGLLLVAQGKVFGSSPDIVRARVYACSGHAH